MIAHLPGSHGDGARIGRAQGSHNCLAARLGPHFEQAVSASGSREPASLAMLAAMYAETGKFAEAAATARRALDIAVQGNNQDLAAKLQARIADYEARIQGK